VSGPETAAFVIPQVMMWYARFIQAISFLSVVLFFFFIQGYIRASKRNRKIGDAFLYCMFINMFLLTILIIKSGYKIGNGREICSHAKYSVNAKYFCQVSQWIWINSGYSLLLLK